MTRSALVALALFFACSSGAGASGSPTAAPPYSFSELLRVTDQAAADLLGGRPQGGAPDDPVAVPRAAAFETFEGRRVNEDAPPPRRPPAALPIAGIDAPQPAGWLMLVSGLAIVGFIGRRRAKPVA